ncbi:MAG: carboxypeptidase regulatory-like domain-containing protein [Myxococcota bacterium]
MRNRHRGAVAALLACLALAGCGEDGFTDRFELSGRVIDASNERGLAGARVVFSTDTGVATETTTGGGGGFELAIRSDTPFGQLRAEAEGFAPEEATVFFDTPRRVVDLTLRPARTE